MMFFELLVLSRPVVLLTLTSRNSDTDSAMNTRADVAPTSFPERRSLAFRRGLSRYAIFVACAVSLLILKGALVTSHDAGLSVPDWPTSYGENMFLFPPSLWIGPIFYEHVHRLLASGVGLLTVILAVWIGVVESRRWVRWLTFGALGAVIVQGILGGLTVILQLPTAVSAAHGVLGQTFFILTIIIAYSQTREWFERRSEGIHAEWRRFFRLVVAALGLIYIQLIVGAVMRHAGAGLAVPDFPTMGGSWWPSFAAEWIDGINKTRQSRGLAAVDVAQIGLHLFHRFWGIAVAVGVLFAVVKVRRWSGASGSVRRTAVWLGGLVVVQFSLGIIAVLTQRDPFLTSFHVLGGALTLALTVLLALRIYPVGGGQRR